MIFVNMHEAKSQLSKLIRRAAAGEEIVVARDGEPVARIVAYTPPAQPRRPGLLAGKITIREGFDEVPPELAAAFDGE
jgi:prevent-host-death family protein